MSKQEPKPITSLFEDEAADAEALAKELGVPPEDELFTEPKTTPEDEAKAAEEETHETETEETTVEEEKSKEEKPVVEEKPADEKPVVEQKVEPEKPVVETEKPKGKPDRVWGEFRALQRALREKDAELEKLKAKPTETTEKPVVDDEFVDPIEKLSKEVQEARAEAKQARERAEAVEKQNQVQSQEQALVAEITKQENAFKAMHPDYDDAMTHLIESRREAFEVMGKLDADAEAWMDKHPEVVERHAKETGLDHEDINDIRKAAKDIAFQIAIRQERQQALAYCKQTGRNIAETMYSLSVKAGHQAEAAKVEEKPVVEKKPTPQEKVQQAKLRDEKQKPFTQKLTAINGNTAPGPKKITSRSELMNLPDDELDKIIADWDKNNPDLFEQLED